jgi:DNA invertase Pin-like site-specific DNA recombinase
MTMDKVAGYFRVSRARDDMKAPELYRDEIERYCRYKHLKLSMIFSDIDFSGRRGARARPGLQGLVEARKEYSAVVVPKLARFGRSMSHLIELFDLFDRDSIGLVFLDLGIDTSTSQGRLLRNVMAAFAEYESDVRSDYTRAANDYRARRGLPNGGLAPYGYRRSGGTYAIHSPEAEIVREIFATYRAGATMSGIARVLNGRGVASPGKRAWTKPAVRNVLENHHYSALLRHGEKLIDAAWAPIVARECWAAVAARLAAISNRGVNATKGLYLLSGLIECGFCGRTLLHRTKQDRAPGQYICRGDPNFGYCRGGAIAEHRAERLVIEAYLNRYGGAFVHDANFAAEPVPLTAFWDKASLERRRAMLASAIKSLELVPKPEGNPRGVGLPRGRNLRISWAVSHDPEEHQVVLGTNAFADLTSKTCVGCGRRKHRSNFLQDSAAPDGRADTCVRCRRSAWQANEPSLPHRPSTAGVITWARWRRERILYPPLNQS